MTLDPKTWSTAVRVNLEGLSMSCAPLPRLLRPEGNARAKVLCFSGGGASKAARKFFRLRRFQGGLVRLVETLAEEWREDGDRY